MSHVTEPTPAADVDERSPAVADDRPAAEADNADDANGVAAEAAAEAVDGRSTRWEAHREQRRVELTHAARRAVHRHGADLSMDEIAARLGTSKSILYRYFADKAGLQNAVGEAVVASIRTELAEASRRAATPRAALQEMVAAYLGMIEHSPSVYYFVTRNADLANSVARPQEGSTAQSAPLSSYLHSVVAVVAEPFAQEMGARGAGESSPDARTAAVAAWSAGTVGFVTATGEWWLTRRGQAGVPSRVELAEQITGWLWTGPVVSGAPASAGPEGAADAGT